MEEKIGNKMKDRYKKRKDKWCFIKPAPLTQNDTGFCDRKVTKRKKIRKN